MPKKTFQAIVNKGADCLIQLKANQPTLLKEAQDAAKQKPKKSKTFHEKVHGRIEVRKVSIYAFEADFPHVRTLVVVERQRTEVKEEKTSEEISFYLSTVEPDKYTPEKYSELVRGHWGGIENRNHWRRDAILEEDRTRTGNTNICSALALLRNTYLAVLARFEVELNLNAIKQFCTHNAQIALDMLLGDKLPKLLQPT